MLKGKNVFITGADGFIGSHLTEELVKEGANVTALVCYNSFNFWGHLENSPHLKDIKIVSGDVRDITLMEKLTQKMDVIFHLAALIAIPYSYVAPYSYLDTNIRGTLNVAQAALKNDVSRLLITSTSEVYGSALYVPIDENHPLQPQSPYSASKIGADMMAKSLFYSADLPLTIVRPFNAYGPRQSARAIIPTIISQIKNNKKISLGSLTPTRDFTYVTDTCQGFIACAKSNKTIGETVNVSTNYEISVLELVNEIKNIMNEQDVEIVADEQRIRPSKSEVVRLWGDNSKLYNLTGFKPETSIQDGLRKTIEWFENPENLKKYKTDIYNV